mgnify:CR=1 FL=1
MDKKLGKQTAILEHPPALIAWASVVGQKEGRGPLAPQFDEIAADDALGQPTWEQAEIALQRRALELALTKGSLTPEDLDWCFAGDLLNQCVSSSFAARGHGRPFLGLYGACSTMGEGLILAALALDGGFGQRAAVSVSSHFCTAERQYRTPLEYGGQRPPTTQWTVTGAGAAVLARWGSGPRLTHVTPGRIVDLGVTDANNMGAAMAPAAADTIAAHLRDTGRSPDFYDRIVTGDLGELGRTLLLELFARDGIDLSGRHTDCGLLIFDRVRQDVHAGGSGCGCCASVLTGYLVEGLRSGKWQNILFCPTGALHSPTSSLQGESVPGICHAVALSAHRPNFT